VLVRCRAVVLCVLVAGGNTGGTGRGDRT
jgi:hypothetical protein